MSNTETYAEKMDRIASELLSVLRDVLGPARRLPEPRADYARYGDHSVTVRDGENGRVEVTAHLTGSGAVREYSARLTCGATASTPRQRRAPSTSSAPIVRPSRGHLLPTPPPPLLPGSTGPTSPLPIPERTAPC